MQIFDEDEVRRLAKWWEEGIDEEFAKTVMNLTFQGLYQRTVLELKVRQLCVISALTVLGAAYQLKTHIKAALRAGATKAEVKEAIIQMTTYCGMPRVAEAYRAYEEVEKELQEKGNEAIS